MNAADSASIRGRVEALFYSSPQFSAGRLRTDSGDIVSFAGSLTVHAHDPVVLHGAWSQHPKFGRQFKVSHFTFDQRMGSGGLAHYLANHPDLKGIGPVKARRIAEAFGHDFDRVVEEEPERIAAVAKLSVDAVQALRSEWLRRRAVNASLTWLASFELTHHEMTALIGKFGSDVVTALETDPYRLMNEIPGFGFKRVELVARKLGTPKEHPSRIRAGIIYCVAERLEQGDCWVDYEELIGLANALLFMDQRRDATEGRDLIEKTLDALIAQGTLACDSLGGRFLVAQPNIHRMERDLAEVFTYKRGPNPHFQAWEVDQIVAAAAANLNEAQRRALVATAQNNLVLVSGGAGSGKTFTVAAITRLYEQCGLRVVLAAPTGKAAKRIEQSAGREAQTLHRLLGWSGTAFTTGPQSPIEADVIIVDEVSMVDVPLGWHLFRAVDLAKTCVVLVGDHNQLPPVGPGNLLRDLIERQPIPTIILDQVVRQAGVLKENSIAILSGEVRRTADRGPDGKPPWIVVDRLSDVLDAQRYVGELFDSVLVERLRFDLLADVQLLTPTRKGPLGVDALNALVQRLVQKKLWGVDVAPPRPGRRPALLRHDRVIQTRNNYDLGVMNGAIGIVTAVGHRPGELRVRFDDREIEFTPENEGAKELALAYALTIHKSQGSEFPCVVVVMHKAHSFMHHRNLFYTGVTRAREVAIVVGDVAGMRSCADKEQVERRKTFLCFMGGENVPPFIHGRTFPSPIVGASSDEPSPTARFSRESDSRITAQW